MAFPLLFLNGGPDGDSSSFDILTGYPYWLFCFTYISLFYINAYILIPRFFLRKKYIDYSIIILVLFCCVYFLQPFDRLLRNGEQHRPRMDQSMGPPPQFNAPPDDNRPPPPPDGEFGPPPNESYRPGAQNNSFRKHRGPGRRRHIDTTSLFIFVMIVALSTASKTVQQWQRTEQRIAQAEADKASAELSFLKAQINPHFLFNTLNNIYSLILTGNENAADSVMKLSNIMRYVTDDVTHDFVPLQDEIDCITDYIELQRLRISKNATVEFTVAGNPAQKVIAPLVLMTFVENVFKYGISKREPSPVNIKIVVVDSGIAFFCENKIFVNKGETENPSTGIGITNTIQRLDHLYPDKYVLDIENSNQEYKIKLTLQS